MPLEVKTLRIVVASPSDVQEERRTVERVATELNNSLGGGLNVLLTVSRWETHAFPGFHPDGPQGLIDEILAIPDCDIFDSIPIGFSSSITQSYFYRVKVCMSSDLFNRMRLIISKICRVPSVIFKCDVM